MHFRADVRGNQTDNAFAIGFGQIYVIPLHTNALVFLLKAFSR